jgi:transposase-like protein
VADSINIRSLAKITSEAEAYEVMERLRWGDDLAGLRCPHCDHDKAYFLAPKNGARRTRTGTVSERRVWKCAKCRRQFSVLNGTIFHGTKVELRTWLLVVFEMCSSKNGVSAREIERKYGLTAKTAWFVTHRIREAMRREPLAGMLRGTVVADETFMGGKPKNRHRQGRPLRLPTEAKRTGPQDKTPVLSLIDRETGEVRSAVVPDVTGATLRKAISEQVDMAATTLHTDASGPYKAIANEFLAHEYVDHSSYEYVRADGVTTNQAENFFSQLKRSIDGTHHHVSREHLARYLAEFDFRYSTRKETDTARMNRLMGRVAGRRLTYRPLTGR